MSRSIGNLSATVSAGALLIALVLSSQISRSSPAIGTEPAGDCMSCHSVNNPQRGNAPLKTCPRANLEFRGAAGAGIPDQIVMDSLADKYQPVTFRHGNHAEMARMGNGCWTCHHNSPVNEPLPPCASCHKANPDVKQPSMIKLEAAYHRHCIFCHKSWSGNENCEACHLKRGATKPAKPVAKAVLPVKPGRVLYEIPAGNSMAKKTVVTFFHDEHITFFRAACEDCHRKSGCEDCHSGGKAVVSADIEHEICASCHPVNSPQSCVKCHRDKPMNSFTHDETRFALSPYHTGLKCESCHHPHDPLATLSGDCRTCHKGLRFKNFDHNKTGFSISRFHKNVKCEKCHKPGSKMNPLKKNCFDCHGDNGPEKFNHAATGFPLKSYHSGIPCSRCHDIKNPVIQGWTCSGCHGDEISYPEFKQGKR